MTAAFDGLKTNVASLPDYTYKHCDAVLLRFLTPVTRQLTENNELSAGWVQNADTWSYFSAEIDSGVSELCFVDVEVTCHVCSGVYWRHAKSWLKAAAGDNFTVVDDVSCTVTELTGRHTQTVVPLYKWITDITATVKRHRWASYDCCV